MSGIVYRIREALVSLVSGCPVGTNYGLLAVLFAICSGRLLSTRGGLLPALSAIGLDQQGVLRAWSAFARGRWKCQTLLMRWQAQIAQEGQWQAHEHGGYHPVACDLTAFFRPTLRNCQTAHYSSIYKRALSAIPFGLLVRIGSVGGKRVPVPLLIERAATTQKEETALMKQTLCKAASLLQTNEALVSDRGFNVQLLQECGVERYVTRGAKNFVAYRATSTYNGRGRKPVRGELVRPLARIYMGKTIEATPPDATESWQEGDQLVVASIWRELAPKHSVSNAPHFQVVSIKDPRFREPLLLVSSLPLTARQLRDFYVDRWTIEMVPQTAKQMLGAARQFVFADEARQRLPELALLAACIMLYTAATQPAAPSGFWDRNPQPTSGRFRRTLAALNFQNLLPLPANIRKKNSQTGHLPKGIQGHRRQPSPHLRPNQPHNRKHPASLTRN